jgi:hypothetical protein
VKTGCNTLHSELQRLILCIFKKEELVHQLKESIILPIYKKGDKTTRSNYRGTSLLPTTYKMLSIILVLRLIPYLDGIIGGSSLWISR